MDITQLLAIGGLLSGLGGVLTAVLANRNVARKNELDSLRDTIETLQKENGRLLARMTALESENESLRQTVSDLQRKNIDLQRDNELLHAQLEALQRPAARKAAKS